MKKSLVKRILSPMAVWSGKHILRYLPDAVYIKAYYFYRLGKRLNLKNPVTFNEKLNWLKLNYRNPICSRLVDKYDVKQHVSETIGEKYVIASLGVWDSFDDIDFSKLPNQFVLKCTHDSGSVIVCKDKKDLDYGLIKKKLNNTLAENYYIWSREWPYKNVKPRIIAEQYIEEESGQLVDYKFFCFGGEVKFIHVDHDRFTNHKRNLYTPDWEYMPIAFTYPTDDNNIIPRPQNLDKMLDLANILSGDFPFVRVDLYSVDDRVFFGEFTFFPDGGLGKFVPEKSNCEIGSWLQLPSKPIYH